MALGKHIRTGKGTWRREKGNSLVKNLRQEYPVLDGINGNTKLKTLEKQLGVNSLSAVLKALRKSKG